MQTRPERVIAIRDTVTQLIRARGPAVILGELWNCKLCSTSHVVKGDKSRQNLRHFSFLHSKEEGTYILMHD